MRTNTTRLPSGIQLATVKLGCARTHVGIMLRGGPVYENDATWGLSHFLEHMVFRGSQKHKDSRAMGLAAEQFGGSVNGATYRDRVFFDTRCDAGAEEEAFALLQQMLYRPRMQGIDIERGIVREELMEAYDDDGQEIDIDNLSFARAFNGTALARSIDGSLDNLDAFDERATRDFHRQMYQQSDAVLVVAGPVDEAKVARAASKVFVPADEARKEEGQAPRRRRFKKRIHAIRTDASQTTLRLVFNTQGYAGDHHALRMLARVLDGGPAARMPVELIDNEGLAYELWCATDNYETAGVIEIGAQVMHDRVADLVRGVVRLLRALRKNAPTRHERERVVARYRRDLADMHDSPDMVAETVARAVQLGKSFVPKRAVTNMQSLTAPTLRKVARRVFSYDNVCCVLVGMPSRSEVKACETALLELV